MFYSVYSTRAIWARDAGDFVAAHKFIMRAGSFSSGSNLKYLLFRSYLACLAEDEADAYENLREFHGCYYEWANRGGNNLNVHEKIWIESFGYYLSQVIDHAQSLEIDPPDRSKVTRLEEIDLSQVRDHFKALFPVSLYERVLFIFRSVQGLAEKP